MTSALNGPLRVGIGGPVGSGKTALTDALCKYLRDDYNIAVITNDIYTREDAEHAPGRFRLTGLLVLRRGGARTPLSVRMRPSTSLLSQTSQKNLPAWS